MGWNSCNNPFKTLLPFKVNDSVVFGTFTVLCNHYIQFQNIFITSKETPLPVKQFLPDFPFPQLLAATSLFSISLDLPFRIVHINGILQFVVLCVCLPSLNIMFLRFTHIVACTTTWFLFDGWIKFTIWLYHNLLFICWGIPCAPFPIYLCIFEITCEG